MVAIDEQRATFGKEVQAERIGKERAVERNENPGPCRVRRRKKKNTGKWRTAQGEWFLCATPLAQPEESSFFSTLVISNSFLYIQLIAFTQIMIQC